MVPPSQTKVALPPHPGILRLCSSPGSLHSPPGGRVVGTRVVVVGRGVVEINFTHLGLRVELESVPQSQE